MSVWHIDFFHLVSLAPPKSEYVAGTIKPVHETPWTPAKLRLFQSHRPETLEQIQRSHCSVRWGSATNLMVFLPETAVFWYKEDRTWEPGCNCLIDRTDSLENFNFSMFWSESALRDHKIQLSLSTGSEKKKSFFFSTHCNLIDKVFLSRFFGGVFGGRLG